MAMRRPPGEHAVGGRHHARGCLAVSEHESKTGVADCTDHLEVRPPTGKPEDHVSAAVANALRQHLRQPVTHSVGRYSTAWTGNDLPVTSLG